ncbi:MAG TPA: hypothetical protein VL486_04435 [Verrucomicrobiae bacterium]|nr:hypothetical protein [Verrucomicrobiae bacterium]
MKQLRAFLALVALPIAVLLTAPVLLLVLPFWIVASVTRAIARRLEPQHEPWNRLIEFHRGLGWKPKPNLDAHYFARGDDVFRLRTDSEGWIGLGRLEDNDIVAMGDSFVFGYGIDGERAFTQLDPRLRVKAVGCTGYSMVQGVMLMREFGERLRGKLVVWFICIENDLYDNLLPNKPGFYRTPFVRRRNGSGDWEIVAEHVSPSRWDYSSDGRPYYPMLAKLCTPGPLADRAFSACDYLIREAKQVCDRAGATLVVVTIPNKYQLSPAGAKFLRSHLDGQDNFNPLYPDERIASICRAQGVPFVAGAEYVGANDYKRHDTHWTAAGHRHMVKLLRDLWEHHRGERASSSSSTSS